MSPPLLVALLADGGGADSAAGGAPWSGGGLSAGAAAGGGGAVSGTRPLDPRVNVKATISCVGNVWTSPFTSKRKTACVPPRYFPCSTRPSFNSNVSAKPSPAKTSATPAITISLEKSRIFIISPRLPDELFCSTRCPALTHYPVWLDV